MICLSGAPSNPKVIRTAARLADAFHGSFTALFVEPPDFRQQEEAQKLRVQANLRLPKSWVPVSPPPTAVSPLSKLLNMPK